MTPHNLLNPVFYAAKLSDDELAAIAAAMLGPWKLCAPRLASTIYSAVVAEGHRRQQPQTQEPEPLRLDCRDWHPRELADALEVVTIGSYMAKHVEFGDLVDAATVQVATAVCEMLRGATAVHRSERDGNPEAN